MVYLFKACANGAAVANTNEGVRGRTHGPGRKVSQKSLASVRETDSSGDEVEWCEVESFPVLQSNCALYHIIRLKKMPLEIGSKASRPMC